jgi:uncharacterized protein YbjT (DUF2867 family)
MKVLVIGATGKYAGLVVPELKRRGARIRALVRNRESERIAWERGVDETVLGDLEDARGLISASIGVDAVFHINPAFARREASIGVTMVEAARAAGVRKFVFSSIIHPSISSLTNHAGKQQVERAIYESGMKFTVLQPTMFMQTLKDSWREAATRGRFSLPYSRRAKASYVDFRDVAESAAIALTTDKLDCGTFEMCAPGMFNRIEVAAMMTEALGQKIEAREISFDDWANAHDIREGFFRQGLRRMFEDYNDHGLPGGNALALKCILGREPRTLAQYFQELARREQKAA